MSQPKRRLNLRARATEGEGEGEGAPLPWPILVADDDPHVHAMTQVLLRDFSFQGRRFDMIPAASAAEAGAILEARPDIPVLLLDVVMETDDAGLGLARHVRETLGNHRIRIILRTGQPGEAPEHEVMLAYDINDYRAKTELTAQKLFTAIVSALRSWTHIDTIERLNATLEQRVEDRTRELDEARRFSESLVETMPNPVWFKDSDGRYRLCNKAFREFFGIEKNPWAGRTAHEALGEATLDDDLRTDAELIGGPKPTASFEAAVTSPRTGNRTIIISKSILKDEAGAAAGIIGTAIDITERKALERELRRLAITDPLTGAFNRRHFLALASQEVDRAVRYDHPLSVIMIDIDHFKTINDTYGHAMGDDVLRQVTDACRASLRDIDVFGRLGGEEFAVLLPATGLDGAVEVAERLRAGVAGVRVPVGTTDLGVTISLGVAERGGAENHFHHLLSRADQALYQAKDEGRDRVATASDL